MASPQMNWTTFSNIKPSIDSAVKFLPNKGSIMYDRGNEKAKRGSRVTLTHNEHVSCPVGVVLDLDREPLNGRLTYVVECGCGAKVKVRSTLLKLVE